MLCSTTAEFHLRIILYLRGSINPLKCWGKISLILFLRTHSWNDLPRFELKQSDSLGQPSKFKVIPLKIKEEDTCDDQLTGTLTKRDLFPVRTRINTLSTYTHRHPEGGRDTHPDWIGQGTKLQLSTNTLRANLSSLPLSLSLFGFGHSFGMEEMPLT